MIPCSISEPSQVFFLGRPVEVVCSNMSPLKDSNGSFKASPVLHFFGKTTRNTIDFPFCHSIPGKQSTLRPVVGYYHPQQGKFELLRLPGAPLPPLPFSCSPRHVDVDLSRYYCGKEGKQGLTPTLPSPYYAQLRR